MAKYMSKYMYVYIYIYIMYIYILCVVHDIEGKPFEAWLLRPGYD